MTRTRRTAVAAALLCLAACAAPAAPDDDPSPVLQEVPVDESAPFDVPGDAPGPPPAAALVDAAPPPAAPEPEQIPAPDPEPEPGVDPPASDAPGFVWRVDTVTAADLPSSWREGCPVGPDSLRAVTLSYVDLDGGDRTGVLVVNESIVEPTRRAFSALYAQRFPISSIRPVDEFGGDDDASMAANNTSAFNCRYAVSDSATPSWSNHAYGRAIDVNPVQNPYVLGGEVLPPNGAPYVDRSGAPGMITRGSDALEAFTGNGFEWGGTWRNLDYQHLER